MAKKDKGQDVSKMGGPTKVMHCKCDHDFQDKKYGRGLRVHNRTEKGSRTIYRCTVCNNEH